MAIITITGLPVAKGFLRDLAQRLEAAGHDVACHVEGTVDPARLAVTDILVPAGTVCGAADIAAMPGLRGIATPLIGTDGIDIAAAARMGVPVVHGATHENALGMAEATFMLMLASLYDFPASMAAIAPGAARPAMERRRMLSGLTVGIWGYGSIARELIARLAGWRSRIIVHNRTVPEKAPAGIRFVSRDTLLSQADILVLLLRLTAETRHILGGPGLALMKRDAVLINTARGELIDEGALLDWLRESPDRRAALDVFETEPLPLESPLRNVPNAILTPHCVGHTGQSMAAMIRDTLANIDKLMAGSLPAATCNPEVAAVWHARWRQGEQEEERVRDEG